MTIRTLVAAAVAAGLFALTAAPAHAAEPEKLWELGGLKWPESALPDPSGETIYVSIVDGEMTAKDGKGGIAKVGADGRMIDSDWVTGLNAPKGLGLVGGTLYAADIDELVAIDVATAKVVKTWPAEGAKFFNDVATGPDGRVYVSDTFTNTIWLLEDDSIKPFLKDDRLNAPNGLLVEGDERLVVAPIGTLAKDGQPGEGAHLVAISLADKSLRDLGDGTPVGNLDGLVSTGPGSYLATDWGKGPLYRISSAGKFETLLTFPPTTADLGYIPGKRMAIIPLSKDGKLVAYRIP